MSSLSSGHGELDHHQHLFALTLMFFAVALSTFSIIVATHRVNRHENPAPWSVTHCQILGQNRATPRATPPIRYCVH